MGDRERTDETRFLPPEPAGPEPELEDSPRQEPPPPLPSPPPPPQTYGYPPPGHPAAGAGQPAGPPPPPGQPYYPPPGQPYYPPPPPGYPPPGQGYPPPPAWGYAQPRVPDNGQAVAGFVFSLVSIGLLVISAGFSSIVSIGCAITGIICSRNGKRKVDAGETPKHRGLAQAGFVIGWVSLVLSVLATIGWILFIILAATGDDFDWESAQAFWG